MASLSTIYSCTHCGAQTSKWSGRCLECGKWGTLVQEVKTKHGEQKSEKELAKLAATPTPLSEISWEQDARVKTGISEFDSVLGGGIVKGSLILLGGDPGIGKSTLALQILQAVSNDARPIYVSGEESGQQIKLRADRLGIPAKSIDFLSQTDVETIAATLAKHKPPLAIIDSIQTIYSAEVDTEPGNVTQVRACTVKLLEAAKRQGVAIILIGHVTKDGMVAGPKTLEHLVDTVLYLEGDRFHHFRILRSVKNRFGPSNEVGLFAMEEKGLVPVANPTQLFVSGSAQLPGSAITCVFEGTRPFLIEIQALVTKSAYATPQRRASGYDTNRLQLLLAVLNQRTKHNFNAMDVHINIVGGLRVQDPATDLAICAALLSALQNKTIPAGTIVLGEVGLSGEVRPVRQLSERLKEGVKLGYKNAWMPEQKTKSAVQASTIDRVDSLPL